MNNFTVEICDSIWPRRGEKRKHEVTTVSVPGRLSPRAAFSYLKPNKTSKVDNSPQKLSNKCSQKWKPPIKNLDLDAKENIEEEKTLNNVITENDCKTDNSPIEPHNGSPNYYSPNDISLEKSQIEKYEIDNLGDGLDPNWVGELRNEIEDKDLDISIETVKNEKLRSVQPTIYNRNQLNIENEATCSNISHESENRPEIEMNLSNLNEESNCKENSTSDPVLLENEENIDNAENPCSENNYKLDCRDENVTLKEGNISSLTNSSNADCLNASFNEKSSDILQNSNIMFSSNHNSIAENKNASPNQAVKNKLPKDRAIFNETEDSFELGLTNSQFLRIENEACYGIKSIYKPMPPPKIIENKPLVEPSLKELLSQREILRQLIREVDELNRSVVKATMNLHPQAGGSKSHFQSNHPSI